eukprot:GHVP01052046.1.p1 GENE.GHVP01052046.1~~GHVP01052046.1.p1  ORF type:complete len:1824 (-),score=350.62 GHVP01052046.1:2389-7860(-)
MRFDFVVSLLLSLRFEEVLQKTNPFFTEKVIQDVASATSFAILLVNRRAQCARSLKVLSKLIGILRSHPEDLKNQEAELKIQLASLINEMTAKRHYVKIEFKSQYLFFDPRFLVFEFAYDILLRKSQIELINTFLSAVRSGNSLCHQMIMGAGKTTVVAPLLSLILADGQNLVVQVVPHALVEFTISTLRHRFSAVIKKNVILLNFSRYQFVTQDLLLRVQQAKDRRSVIVSSPTSIKSLYLKAIQTLHILERSTSANDDIMSKVQSSAKFQIMRLRNAIGKMISFNIAGTTKKNALSAYSDGVLTESEMHTAFKELDLTVRILSEFHEGILLLDEVDVILHPLKSELHWPIGLSRFLDFTRGITDHSGAIRSSEGFGMRWMMPWHILDALFYSCGHSKKMNVRFKGSREAWTVLGRIKDCIESGVEKNAVQLVPHLIVLNSTFYHLELKPVLAQWTFLFIRAAKFRGISDENALRFMCTPEESDEEMSISNDLEVLYLSVNRLTVGSIKMLNLARELLNSVIPHVLTKVNRVSFGVLRPEELAAQLKLNPKMPKNRLLLAIPFLGKDAPSLTSEFAHPDVIICLTILSYRYQGMRMSDFTNLLSHLTLCVAEETGPPKLRPAAEKFRRMVENSDGRVRGTNREANGTWERYLRNLLRSNNVPLPSSIKRRKLPDLGNNGQSSPKFQHEKPNLESGNCTPSSDVHIKKPLIRILPPSYLYGDWMSGIQKDPEINPSIFGRIWPLEIVDVQDWEQILVLYHLLWNEPMAIDTLLSEIIFPLTLEHTEKQITATAQELGGNMLFKRRLGFSGTPSELIPIDFGPCNFEDGTNGAMVYHLTNPEIISIEILPTGWTVSTILDRVSKGKCPLSTSSEGHALIDTGALVTGMTNKETAKELLERGLNEMKGVVFLDEEDRQMLMLRKDHHVMKLEESGISNEKRFTFYDQVHTTGQDIKQCGNAIAFLTVGKDMTFRELAQGAWRMRGISNGQTIKILIPPEVLCLVEQSLRDAEEDSTVFRKSTSSSKVEEARLRALVLWLHVKTIEAESLQYRVLASHNASNVWRKKSFKKLLEEQASFGSNFSPPSATVQALNVFREDLNFSVASKVAKVTPLPRKLEQRMELLPLGNDDRLLINNIISELREHDIATNQALRSSRNKKVKIDLVLEAEQEQEVEEEEEQEQEQEQEKEKEQEKEQEVIVVSEGPASNKYSRTEEDPIPWELSSLGEPNNENMTGFFNLNQFGVFKKLLGNPKPLSSIPSYMLVSRNFFRKTWSFTTYRRLKNVVVVMEWIRDNKRSDQTTSTEVSKELESALIEAYEVFDLPLDSLVDEKTLQGIFKFILYDSLTSLNHLRSETSKPGGQQDANNLNINNRGERLTDFSQNMIYEMTISALLSYIKTSIKDSIGIQGNLKERTSQLKKNLDFSVDREPSNDKGLESLFLESTSTQDNTKSLLGLDNDLFALPSQPNPPLKSDSLTFDSDFIAAEGANYNSYKPEIPDISRIPFSCSFNDILNALVNLSTQLKHDENTQFVIVSLEEAESIRAAMHVAQNNNYPSAILGSSVSLSLRNLQSRFFPLDSNSRSQDTVSGLSLLLGEQHQTAHAVSRFFNSEVSVTEGHISLLLRTLKASTCAERKEWFMDVRKCRRRNQQVEVTMLPIGKVLTLPNESSIKFKRILAARLRIKLIKRNLSLADAFHAFDQNREGQLTMRNIYLGFKWLHLGVQISQLIIIFEQLDADGDGFVTFEDFTEVFRDPDEEVMAEPVHDLLMGFTSAGSHFGSIDSVTCSQKEIEDLQRAESDFFVMKRVTSTKQDQKKKTQSAWSKFFS